MNTSNLPDENKPDEYHLDLKTISIWKTRGEWEVIEDKISKSDKKELSFYIRSEIRKILSKFNECPDCITKGTGDKIQKRPYIPVDYLADLNNICILMDQPVSVVIDQLIIAPLLLPDLTPIQEKRSAV